VARPAARPLVKDLTTRSRQADLEARLSELEGHADEIAEIEALDNGKPIRDARNVDLPDPFTADIKQALSGTVINAGRFESRSLTATSIEGSPNGNQGED
jgi:hypothetical protein